MFDKCHFYGGYNNDQIIWEINPYRDTVWTFGLKKMPISRCFCLRLFCFRHFGYCLFWNATIEMKILALIKYVFFFLVFNGYYPRTIISVFRNSILYMELYYFEVTFCRAILIFLVISCQWQNFTRRACLIVRRDRYIEWMREEERARGGEREMKDGCDRRQTNKKKKTSMFSLESIFFLCI